MTDHVETRTDARRPSDELIPLRAAACVLAACVVYALVHSVLMHYALRRSPGILWGTAFVSGSTAIVWVVLSIPVAMLARKLSYRRAPSYLTLLAHVVFALLVALIGAAWFRLAGELVVHGRGQPPFIGTFLNQLDLNLFIYLAVCGGVLAAQARERSIDAALNTMAAHKSLASARLRVLAMQLQPHFLFNTLHSISELVHSDSVAARNMSLQLKELLRESLDQTSDSISLEKELRILKSYVAIQRMRFDDRLVLDIDVPDEARSAQVPPLLLQPLVENAIKHGGRSAYQVLRISIVASVHDDTLRIEVRDDGRGLDSVREGHGLRNTRLRLQHLYGDRVGLRLAKGTTGGAVTIIELPFTQDEVSNEPIPTTTDRLRSYSGDVAALSGDDAQDNQKLSLRSLKIRVAVIVFALWTVWAIVWLLQSKAISMIAPLRHRPPLWWLFTRFLVNAWSWAILTFLVAWVAKRFAPSRRYWMAPITIHVVTAAAIVALMMVVRWKWGLGLPNSPLISPDRAHWAAWDLLAFTMIVVFTHMRINADRYRVREFESLRVDREVAAANVDILKWQLRPHFLTESLDDTARFATTDPARADSLVTSLGDLLRLMLQQVATREASIEKELETVRAYVNTIDVRAPGSIQFKVNTSPDALAVRIPGLLILPLIDQLLPRDVVAPRSTCLTFNAAIANDNLQISAVATNHPAQIDERGLKPLHARLRAAFRDDYRLEASLTADGNASLYLDIPISIPAEPQRDLVGAPQLQWNS